MVFVTHECIFLPMLIRADIVAAITRGIARSQQRLRRSEMSFVPLSGCSFPQKTILRDATNVEDFLIPDCSKTKVT